MITCGREWATACELSWGRSGRYGTATFALKEVCGDALWTSRGCRGGCLCLCLHRFLLGGFGGSPGATEESGSSSIPRTLFMLFLIVLVTRAASRRHRIAAVRHRVCRPYEERKSRVILQLNSNLPSPIPIPGCGRPPLTLHYLLWPFLPFPEKRILERVGFAASNYLAGCGRHQERTREGHWPWEGSRWGWGPEMVPQLSHLPTPYPLSPKLLICNILCSSYDEDLSPSLMTQGKVFNLSSHICQNESCKD